MVIASVTLLNVAGLIRKNCVNSLYKQVRAKTKSFLDPVTISDIQRPSKLVQSNGQIISRDIDLQAKLQDKPFWIWD
jgi:hypothetical protein